MAIHGKIISENILSTGNSMPLSKAEKSMIENHVKDIRYAQCSPRTIFCVVVVKDGYELYGSSSCKDLNTFDEDKGKDFALRHALARLYRRLNENVDSI